MHPFIREAKEELEKRIATGEEEPTAECSYKSRPQLTVKLPEATPEAFRMVLNYIYTDRIDPTEKGLLFHLQYIKYVPIIFIQ